MGEGHHGPAVPMRALAVEYASLYECLVDCTDQSGTDEGQVEVPVVFREGFGGHPTRSCSC